METIAVTTGPDSTFFTLRVSNYFWDFLHILGILFLGAQPVLIWLVGDHTWAQAAVGSILGISIGCFWAEVVLGEPAREGDNSMSYGGDSPTRRKLGKYSTKNILVKRFCEGGVAKKLGIWNNYSPHMH